MSGVMIELPHYRSVKHVWALKISHIVPTPRGWILGFEDQRYAPHEVTEVWRRTHNPEVGGYYVHHEDGRRTFMGADEFEGEFKRASSVS